MTPAVNGEADRRGSDASRSALEFIHGLLGRGPADGPGLDGLLKGLAAAFAVSGAGLVALGTGKVLARRPTGDDALPWEEDPELTERVLRAPASLSVPRRAGGGALVTAIQPPSRSGWLLWVETEDGRAWNAAEGAALALAGHALGGLLQSVGPKPRWAEQLGRAERQKDLETAARVSARLAHDFGNILTGIVGFCDLSLALKLPADSQLSRYLRELQRCARTAPS